MIRLGEVAESLEEWAARESIFVCRDSMREQIENLTRLKREYERAEETTPGRLSLVGQKPCDTLKAKSFPSRDHV